MPNDMQDALPEWNLYARLDAAAGEVVPGSLYRHRKTGEVYHVRLVALNEADKVPVVVYGNETRTLTWVRPLAEFTDGRFEYVE